MRRVAVLSLVLLVPTSGCRLEVAGATPDELLGPEDGATADASVTLDGAPPDGAPLDTTIDGRPGDGGPGGDGAPDATTGDALDATTDGPAEASPDGGTAFVPVALATGTACPTGSAGPAKELLAAPRAPESNCACTCDGATPNPCEDGNVTAKYDKGGPGGGACDVDKIIVADGTCHVISGWDPKAISGSAPSPRKLACGAKGTPPALAFDEQVHVCALPAATPTASACWQAPGDRECPAAAPKKRLLYPRTGIVDARKCACNCATVAKSCSAPVLRLYGDDKCAGSPKDSIDFNDKCNSVSVMGPGGPKGYRFGSTPDKDACEVTSAPAPTGDVKLPTPVTLCCP